MSKLQVMIAILGFVSFGILTSLSDFMNGIWLRVGIATLAGGCLGGSLLYLTRTGCWKE